MAARLGPVRASARVSGRRLITVRKSISKLRNRTGKPLHDPAPQIRFRQTSRPLQSRQAASGWYHAKRVRENGVKIAKWALPPHPASALDCAQLRNANATGNPVEDICVRSEEVHCIKPRQTQSGDTNSPQGRNASRARLIACAPIRILLHCSRRSQNSLLPRLASHSSLVNNVLTLTRGKPLTLRHLTIHDRVPARVLGSALASDACVPHHLFSRTRRQAPLHFPEQTGMGRKDAQRTIVARPGRSCKSLQRYRPNCRTT